MYLHNKYTITYYNIIAQAQSRTTTGYTEKHHIIPRSLGGSNDPDNLVVLTAREHLLCHLLLCKMTAGPARHKMVRAYALMSGQNKQTTRIYASLREEYALIQSQKMQREGNSMYGRKHSPESIVKMKENRKSQKGEDNPMYGKKHSEETIQKIREARAKQDVSHLKGREITWADKISKTLKGRKPTAERNAKVSDALTGRKRSKTECEAISKGLKGRDPWWSRVRMSCVICKEEISAVGAKRHFARHQA